VIPPDKCAANTVDGFEIGGVDIPVRLVLAVQNSSMPLERLIIRPHTLERQYIVSGVESVWVVVAYGLL